METTSTEPLWEVALPGYTWYEVKDSYHSLGRGGCVLRWPSPPSEPRESRTVNLLQLAPELFREFAQVKTTLKGIKKFADQYGLLGIQAAKKPRRRRRGTHVSLYRYVDDEPQRLWAEQVLQMKYLIKLWTACQDDDRDKLRRHIRWTPDGSKVILDSKAERGNDNFAVGPRMPRSITISPPDPGTPLPGPLLPGDLVLPAALFVREILGRQLRGGPPSAPYHQPAVHPRIAWERDADQENGTVRLCLRTRPETLHQALWLQAAEWVTAGRPLKSCQQCKKWFSVPHKAPRTRVGFCSDACRLRAYRERQDLARQMAAAGKSFDAIAQELGSDMNAIKRWVTGRKEK